MLGMGLPRNCEAGGGLKARNKVWSGLGLGIRVCASTPSPTLSSPLSPQCSHPSHSASPSPHPTHGSLEIQKGTSELPLTGHVVPFTTEFKVTTFCV